MRKIKFFPHICIFEVHLYTPAKLHVDKPPTPFILHTILYIAHWFLHC